MNNNSIDNKLNEKMVLIFKALSDPVRIEIIKYLKNIRTEVICGEIGQAVGISKPSGTYHFKLLQQAELINVRKSAREKYIELNKSTFDKYVTGFFDSL
ncbi:MULTISPECIES: helix-turn-helix transcriptional regulator [unclassified Gilliamella]|uniref:ArsR/SmtB family transcription factor n=1 Tax=unclassified Gilliamella TaxID=2685620 RepID=UPI000A32F85C|nr:MULTISPECIES: helix-turn-helix domain-containing protein [unclassified Gilliamella]OTQ72734.1 transcriptional regulator [Gilliamella sp. N-G2]OTQ77288.1 transcriptional regulator [Gilliamella sp. N-W3]